MKTSELTGAALDWAVAMCELKTTGDKGALIHLIGYGKPIPNYSSDWAQGGPIIEREGIELQCNTSALQAAAYKNANPDWFACLKFKRADHWHGTTPLIAAMRCYVASKLGDDIDLPKELT
jgi:hypothetical protein